MRSWALASSAVAPVALIGGWTLAARRQPGGFDSTVETISALAGHHAADRWLMTTALVCVGICHVLTALGLSPAAGPGRVALGAGGVATLLVAAFPLPVAGPAPAHAVSAGLAFAALSVWPALAWRRHLPVPATLRATVSCLAAVVLLALVAWFATSLGTGVRVGLAERVAAGAQAFWPLVVTVSLFVQGRPGSIRSWIASR
ncbi:DUF998 domain-containing protein [Actinoplanes sp. HUAS TT8]|uniref:DUF998 domain-containing protein n=1 Tax=Actinoplanes sp. HUAS TT8 TaxID=3447453 RepID=UPI003F51F288